MSRRKSGNVAAISDKAVKHRAEKQKEVTVRGARPEMKKLVAASFVAGDEIWHKDFGYGVIKGIEDHTYEVNFGGSLRRVPKTSVKVEEVK